MLTVTIIGAGPAGCVAAALLARGGVEVTLVEQHRFPRDKVCGECLSAMGIETLTRAKLNDVIQRLGPSRMSRAVVVSPDGFESSLQLPAEMWGISRQAMDNALLAAARGSGVWIVQPARCEGIERNGRVTARVRKLDDNAMHVIETDWLIVADGKGALGGDRPTPSGDLGLKAHFTGVEDAADAISLFGVRGHYVGLAPIENDGWNVAMNVPAKRLREARGDFDGFFQQLLNENRGLGRRFVRARRSSDWLTSPLPRFAVAPQWPDRIIPVGNAAAALEPIGGEGMGLAMRSAEMVAAEMLASIHASREVDTMALRTRMNQLWKRRSWSCRVGAKLLSNPKAASFATRLLKPLTPLALRLIGKVATPSPLKGERAGERGFSS